MALALGFPGRSIRLAMLATCAMLAYVIFVVALLCLPFGQPIVGRGRHVGDLSTQR